MFTVIDKILFNTKHFVKPLGFEAIISTFLNNLQPFKVFDALFYWQNC